MIADFPVQFVTALIDSLRFSEPLSANPTLTDLHIPDSLLIQQHDVDVLNAYLQVAFGGVPSVQVAGPCYSTDILLIAGADDLLHDGIAIASAFLHGMAYAHR